MSEGRAWPIVGRPTGSRYKNFRQISDPRLQERVVRGKTALVSEDIIDIARMWFGGSEIKDIAAEYLTTPEEIEKVVRGSNWLNEWTQGVIKLLVEGVDCSRSFVSKPNNGHMQDDSMVLSIRSDGMKHEMTIDEIAKAHGVRRNVARNILYNRTYRRPEYAPEGWDLKRRNYNEM
jgi:hypothetical protein